MKKTLPTFLLLFVGTAAAQDAVQYNLRISNAVQHTAEVSARFPASSKDNSMIRTPI